MEWWIWILVGFGLLGLELFIPSGFSLLIIGLSFLITGSCVAFGLNEPAWLPWSICLTSFVILFASIRKPLARIFGFDGPNKYDESINSEVIIRSEIGPGGIGQGEMQGTQWSIRNIGEQTIKVGERCKVVRVDGITVEVKR